MVHIVKRYVHFNVKLLVTSELETAVHNTVASAGRVSAWSVWLVAMVSTVSQLALFTVRDLVKKAMVLVKHAEVDTMGVDAIQNAVAIVAMLASNQMVHVVTVIQEDMEVIVRIHVPQDARLAMLLLDYVTNARRSL